MGYHAGQLIRSHRREKRLKQSDVEKHMGWNRVSLSRIEAGANYPPVGVELDKLLSFLSIDPIDFQAATEKDQELCYLSVKDRSRAIKTLGFLLQSNWSNLGDTDAARLISVLNSRQSTACRY